MDEDAADQRLRLEHSHTREEIQARLAEDTRGNYLRDWIYGGIDGAAAFKDVVVTVV